VTPSATVQPTKKATSAYELSDLALCDLIRDASVLRWHPESKLGRSGRLECDIDLRVGVDSNIRTTKADAEFQIGAVVAYQDAPGELVKMGTRTVHVVAAGNEAFPELAAWAVLRDDLSVMFRVFNLKDTPVNRRSVLDELSHILSVVEAP
jgi:hypothetical protein